jgi:hypothetical protein
MNSETLPHESPKLASAGSARRPRLRFSLRWLLIAMAFLAVVVSHLNTSLKLRQADATIARQQAQLKQLRNELGVFEITDAAKAHVLFVRQTEDKAWRWRVYLPPSGDYMMKWAIDEIPSEGLSSQWEGQSFQPHPKELSTFNVDVFLRKGADGKWRWFLRYPWGELTRELPDDHVLLAPSQPIVISGDLRNRSAQVTLCDPRKPVVLFRYQLMPQADFDAAQAQGRQPDGPFPGIMVWIEPAK